MRHNRKTGHLHARPSTPSGLYIRWLAVGLALLAIPRVVAPLMRAVMPKALTWGWIEGTAWASHRLIRAAGIPCTLSSGNLLHLTNHTFRIDADCTGGLWYSMYVLAVLLVPVQWSRKVGGICIGLPILISFNFARLVLVAAISEYAPGRFSFVHDVLMQSLFLLLTTTVWAIWMWRSEGALRPGWATVDTSRNSSGK